MSSVNIRKRGNKYQYQFEITPIDGKRKQFSKSGFKTKSEALEAGNKAYNEYLTAGVPFKEKDISMSDYFDYWIKNYCEKNLRYSTIQKYKVIINNHLKPKLGIYKLASMTSVALNIYINEICEENTFSRAYLSNILKVLKGAFRDATNLFGFIKYDPSRTLRLPKMECEKKDVRHVYTQDEIDRILNKFKDNDTFTCVFLTSCFTGMRTGEVCALTWDDIDLENGIIDIKHSVYDKPKDEKGRWFIGHTKTLSGTRKIHISKTLLIALKNYKNKQSYKKKLFGAQYHTYYIEEVKNEYGKVIENRIVENQDNLVRIDSANFVFTKHDGTYVGTDIIRYPFKIIHEELGINSRFYDLRGSYATKILNNGVEIRDVADILGHRYIETTENYYISSTEENRKNATDIFEQTTGSDVIENIINYSY